MAADASSLEDAIYECALVPDRWPKVLGSLADIAGARGGCFISGDALRLRHWAASDGMAGIMADIFRTDAINRTARRGRVLAVGNAGFVRDNIVHASGEAEADPLYRDHLWPCGLGYATGTSFRMPTGEVVIFSLEREHAKGPVGHEAVRRLDTLRPHIARAAYLSARQQLTRARDTVALLAQLGLPAIVFSNVAKVLAANALAEQLTSHLVWRADDRIALKDRGADPMLQHAIATIESDAVPAVRSFIVRGAEGSASMVAHALPIRGSARDVFVRCAAVLMLTPVAMPVGPPIELIQSLFDLTPSEASVARKIAAGATVEEIASGGGVSSNTVRTQVKGVLAKTGCRRQAEVASLLSNLGGPLSIADAPRS